MRQWLTLPEIAERALPGLPLTKQGLAKLADAKGWRAATRDDGKPAARTRKGRGGGWEYHVSLLPVTARAALVDLPAAPAATVPDLAAPDAAAARLRDARIAVLDAARSFADERDGAVTQDAAYETFAIAYNAGTVAIEPWVRDAVAKVSRTRLYAWRAALKAGDGAGLAGRQGRKAGTGIVDRANDGAVATFIGALILKQPFLSAEHIRDQVAARFGATLDVDGTETALPAIGAFRRFVAGFKAEHQVALARETDPDRFKSHYRIAGLTRHAHVERLNQVWQIDASPADVLCLDGRYSIYVLADVFSRRMMATVTRTPRTAAMLLLVRKAILAWGVPESVETDNGSDFISHAARRAFLMLGIRHEVCDPFSPEQKGIVERGIGTVQRGFMTLLPGFIGHSVADRKSIEGRKAFAARLGVDDAKAFCVDLAHGELAAMLDQWLADKYALKPHSGLAGMSPFARAQSCTAPVRRVESERALDVMLWDVAEGGGLRTVTKQGVRVGGGYYLAASLMVGEKVLVRLDPEDLGKVYCFSADGTRFLAEAVNPEAVGIDRGAAVALARAEQKRMIDDAMAGAKAEARKIGPRDMIGAVLRKSAEDAGKLVTFPKRQEIYETPAIAAASESLRERPIAETRLSDEEAALLAEMKTPPAPVTVAPAEPQEIAPPASNVIALPETPKQRFRRALDIEARIAAGEPVGEDAALWLGGYQTTPEYQAHVEFYAEFGSAWLKAGA